jgi:uncharacterized OsmC-like protein
MKPAPANSPDAMEYARFPMKSASPGTGPVEIMTSFSPSISITHQGEYQFLVDFGAGIGAILTDEPDPIGAGEGPSPEQMLLAGVTNCLCASLVFALAKFRRESNGMSAQARCSMERNDQGRLRIKGVEVAIRLGAAGGEDAPMQRALAQFEDFCTVTESVKRGIPVAVTVLDGAGKVLKTSGVTQP